MLNKFANNSQDKTDVIPVDFQLSVVKSLGAQWMFQLYDYLKLKPDVVQNGFRAVVIVDCVVEVCFN